MKFFAYALCALCIIVRPVFAQTPPAAVPAAVPAVKVSPRDLPNFGVVAPGIYRGAAPTAEGLRRLKASGVRTVIDLRIERKGQKEEAVTAAALGLRRIRIPMGREAPTKKQIAQFLAVLAAAPSEPVFVHCQYGADRTGAMVGIYRERRQNWTFNQTYREMRHYGFNPKLWELKGAVQ